MLKRICSLITVIALTLGLTGCGSTFSNLRLAVALADPLITYLESQGKVDREKAERQKQDVRDIIDVTERLDQQWKALPKAAFRSEKLIIIQTAYKDYQAIINRGNFVNVPAQLEAALGIISGIFDTLISFYGPIPAGAPLASEAALFDNVQSRVDLLKKELKRR